MSNAPVDHGRRRFLTIATSVVGGVGAIGAAVPFIASWNPSEKAKQAGAAVTADISKLEDGQLIRGGVAGQTCMDRQTDASYAGKSDQSSR